MVKPIPEYSSLEYRFPLTLLGPYSGCRSVRLRSAPWKWVKSGIAVVETEGPHLVLNFVTPGFGKCGPLFLPLLIFWRRRFAMRLGPNEQIIQRYYFNGAAKGDCGVLTNQRLEMTFGANVDSYPLSKITAIKTSKGKLGTAAIYGLAFAWFSLWLYNRYDPDALLQAEFLPWMIGALAAVLTVMAISSLVIILFVLIAVWKGKTEFVIRGVGPKTPFGPKHYWVDGRNGGLYDFMEAVNSRLS